MILSEHFEDCLKATLVVGFSCNWIFNRLKLYYGFDLRGKDRLLITLLLQFITAIAVY